jgi:thiol-disulfide isomerase/thioredoxin
MKKQKERKIGTQTRKQEDKPKINWGRYFTIAFVTIIVILFIVNNTRDDAPAINPQHYPPSASDENIGVHEERKPAFDFTLKSIEGKSVKLSDFKGKIVIVDFWATWCMPCREGIPDLIALQNEYKDVQVIGITVDQNPMEVVPSFVKEFKINYPILLSDSNVLQQYGGIDAIPTSFIISKDGKIIKKYVGLQPKSYYVNIIHEELQI